MPVLLLLRPPPRHPAVMLADAVVASDVLPTAVVQAAFIAALHAEVQHWGAKITFGRRMNCRSNMVATVMQIESLRESGGGFAGAQGLFQVMPFHFEPGETMVTRHQRLARHAVPGRFVGPDWGSWPGFLPATTAAPGAATQQLGYLASRKHSAITPGAAVSMRK